jgi:hypothetical protein
MNKRSVNNINKMPIEPDQEIRAFALLIECEKIVESISSKVSFLKDDRPTQTESAKSTTEARNALEARIMVFRDGLVRLNDSIKV